MWWNMSPTDPSTIYCSFFFIWCHSAFSSQSCLLSIIFLELSYKLLWAYSIDVTNARWLWYSPTRVGSLIDAFEDWYVIEKRPREACNKVRFLISHPLILPFVTLYSHFFFYFFIPARGMYCQLTFPVVNSCSLSLLVMRKARKSSFFFFFWS